MRLYGAADIDVRGEGISPRRLPDWTRLQLPELMDVMVRMPSGVRLRFATDTKRLGLEFLATNMVTPPNERRPIPFNLELADELFSASSSLGNQIILNPQVPGEFKLQRGQADTVWFDELPVGKKICEIWLPHNAFVELRTLVIDDDAIVESAEPELRPKWIHYGSSISHCMEAQEPALIWPAVAARHAGVALQNLGFGGQCHLDQFIARTMRDAEADVMSIKAGINVINMDSMRERVFTPALHGFIDTIREGQGETPIIVISPILCPSAEDNPGPTIPNAQGKFVTLEGHAEVRNGSLTLKRVREIIADVVQRRRGAGDANLHYLDGLSLFGAADAADLPDDLHPSPAGYIRMGERFAPTLAATLGGSLFSERS
ncbi:MAG: GDSL-type esterase/lipase family protein [Gammaproteobacteria bacterium]|nr:GDSL-type esterase/lipase family protein [Gammaproteobacteria bacterium]